MYRALYRKYRPATFADVVGQEAISAALASQITQDKIGHAYIFTGTRGTGKTTCAKIFAKAVNCENPNGAEPCGECPLCVGMDNGSILDVVEIDAASNNGVDDVRELREETAYRPSRGRFRVYIVDEVHMLSTAAFNALLKILEEPPSHVIFILATTEIHKVPATILSRCQRFDFLRIAPDKIAGRLARVAQDEGIELAPDAADQIARLGDGSMRDALSLLDTCAGLGQAVDIELVRRMAGITDKRYLFEISDAVRAGDVHRIVETIARLRQQSIDVRRLCEELCLHFCNLLLVQAKPDGSLLENVPQAERAQYLDAAGSTNEAFVIAAIERLSAALDKMGRSFDPRVELELALFELCEKAAPATAAGAPVPQQAGAAPMATTPQPSAVVPTAAPVVSSPAPSPEEPALPVIPKEPQDRPPWEEPGMAAEQPQPDETPGSGDAPAMQKEGLSEEQPQTAAAAPPAEQPPAPPPQKPTMPGTEVFQPWEQVLEAMRQTDKMLYSYMAASSAYTDGTRVLIDGGELFLTFMRTNAEAKEMIRTAIASVTGKRYSLGPYEAPAAAMPVAEAAPKDDTQATLDKWQQMGVEIEYE